MDNEQRVCIICGANSQRTDTAKINAAQNPAECVSAIRVVSIRRLPPEPVYNMEVERTHNFAVNGGLIVHNCIDATRYALERVFGKYRSIG